MAAVRLAPELTCPGCDRFVHGIQLRDGVAWLTCPKCDAAWLDVAIPASDTPADALRHQYRAPVADALTAACPALADAPSLARFNGAPHEPVVHVQVTATRRIAHLYRYAPLLDVLRALGIGRPALPKAG